MDRVIEKTERLENGLTKLLRKFLKQKEEMARRYKEENDELNKLVSKQNEMIGDLRSENTKLCKELNEYDENDKFSRAAKDILELAEQNSSLKEQLLISLHHNSMLVSELKEAKQKIKQLSKIVFQSEQL